MTLFEEKAPWIMDQLIKDFDITVQDAAAILGNLGHESGGFKFLQEKKPLIPGSKGGYGWPQWTGPRRRAYEAYCAKHKLDPASDKANYAWLFIELKYNEKGAIPSIKGDNDTLDKDVKDFELAFERAGVKHYESRAKWARIALNAYNKAKATPTPKEVIKPSVPAPKAPTAEPAPVKKSWWKRLFGG